MTDPSQPADDIAEPANLRFLRRLITVLTAVMIGGVLVMIVLFVTRFYGAGPSTLPALPDTITLPQGTDAQAVTFGGDWIAVVSDDNRILIFDRASGALRQTVAID